jgi:hypothetical protein
MFTLINKIKRNKLCKFVCGRLVMFSHIYIYDTIVRKTNIREGSKF